MTTMRHVSFFKNLDNLDAYFDRQSSNVLTIEIQSNLNFKMDRMKQNRSNAAIINKAVLSLS